MDYKEKQILLVDLCARLPYGVIFQFGGKECHLLENINYSKDDGFVLLNGLLFSDCKLYLRPMSSMTEEEFNELAAATELQYDQLELMDWGNDKTLEFYLEEIPQYCVIKVFDWLNAHHFDYRGLIEKGLALEAPEDMYNSIKTK